MKLKDLDKTKETVSRVTRQSTEHWGIADYMCYWGLMARIGKEFI